jgi:flagellar biosynthesis/type III secretory pathway M-ring protein FliF/YscJ
MAAAAAKVAALLPVTYVSLPVHAAYVNPVTRKLTSVMEFALAAVTLALIVAFVVGRPLLRGPEVDRREDEKRAALEAAKESKYREIRDAELDFQMGKLTEGDYKTTDRELRTQAIEILRELDALTPEDEAAAAADR